MTGFEDKQGILNRSSQSTQGKNENPLKMSRNMGISNKVDKTKGMQTLNRDYATDP